LDVGRGALNVSAVTLRGAMITDLTIESCAFSNNRPQDDHGTLDFGGSTVSGLTINKNSFTQTEVFPAATDGSVISFRDGRVSTSAITANVVSGVTTQHAAIEISDAAQYDVTVVNGLAVTGNTFTEVVSTSRGLISAIAGLITINGLTIEGNEFLNNKVGDSGPSALLSLPSGQALLGPMTVADNRFVNAAGVDGTAVYWDSNKASGSTSDSNLVIEDNHFDGFSPVSIFLKDTGLVRMERNTFGPASASATGGDGLAEETSTSTGLVVNKGGANLGIATWYPSKVEVDRGACALKVDIAASGLAGPVVVALYATRGDDAELYLGEYRLSAAGTVTVPLEDDLLLKNPWLHAQGGNIRVQTHKAYGSGRAASQFSRWVNLSAFTCEVAYTMEKKAYSDAARTTQLPPGTVLELGSTVYFTYELTNHDPVFPTTVTVVDSMKKKVKGDDKVCVVTVDPGETDTTTCRWDHQVMRT
jgi:hypothetical protein